MSYRLKGYALIESMFAMVVIMICFGTGMTIFSNVMYNSRASLETLARVRIQAEAGRCKAENQFIDGAIRCDEFVIERSIVPHPESEHLYELRLEAITPDGRSIYEYHEFLVR